jgi:hypothetical protein
MSLVTIVEELIAAEESQDVETMKKHLDTSFAIIRGDGDISKYDKYLDEVRTGGRRGRALEKVPPPEEERHGDCCWIVRSVVKIKSGKRFRNSHVFVEKDGILKCVAWQVTPTKTKTKG